MICFILVALLVLFLCGEGRSLKDGIHLKIHILRGRSFEGGAHYKIFTSRGALIRGGRSFEEIRYSFPASSSHAQPLPKNF